jgi:SAM-dependent methyltransferase
VDDLLRASARRARDAVRAGTLRGAAFVEALRAVRFDQRDRWLDELFGLPEVPADLPGLPPGTVPYWPCDADAVVHAVREAPLGAGDVFVDLGAGLGRPLLLAHLASGARAIGVELQPHLIEHARGAAARLQLDAVQLLPGDAAAGGDLPDGTVYFVYSSFNGAALARVLAGLARVAARHPIVLCAVDFEVREPWLRPRRSPRPELMIYDSVEIGAAGSSPGQTKGARPCPTT